MIARFSLKVNAIRSLAITLFFLVWELVADFRIISPQFIAGPSSAILSLFQRDVLTSILDNARVTLFEIAVSYLIAASIGFGIGLMIGLSKYLTSIFEPFVLLLFAVPKITLLPLFILWFGIGIFSKIAFGIFAGIFPVAVNTIAGAKSINISNIILAKSMGASNLQIYRKIAIPCIIPTAFAGLRLSLILVAVTVTLAEMYQGTVLGLGSLIFYWSTIFLTGPLYGVILVFSAVLIAVNQTLLYFEKKLNLLG
jgi:NitT/TauT family transport system permease protein